MIWLVLFHFIIITTNPPEETETNNESIKLTSIFYAARVWHYL